MPFGDRNRQFNPARLLVLRIAQRLDLRLAHLRANVAVVAVVLSYPLGVFRELGLLVGSAAGDPRERPVRAVFLHLVGELAVGDRLVA
jgi:hypothetical protein